MHLERFNYAPMPSDRDVAFITRAVQADSDHDVDEVCKKADEIIIYVVDERTMDCMSKAVSRGHTLGDSDFDYELPRILFPRTNAHRTLGENIPGEFPDEWRLPRDIPQECIDECIASFLKRIGWDIEGKWEEARSRNPELEEAPVDFLGLYFSQGPINRMKNVFVPRGGIPAPEIWICYKKIKDSAETEECPAGCDRANAVLYRTIGVILHELGHAVMDSHDMQTIPYSLYSSVEEPLADKIMLDFLKKRSRRRTFECLTGVYTYNRACVENHSMVRYSTGARLHRFERIPNELFSWASWRNAKWFLYSKRRFLEDWYRLIHCDEESLSYKNIFDQIVRKPLGYARGAGKSRHAIARKAAIRSLAGMNDVDSQVNFIVNFFEKKRLANSDVRVLFIASNVKVAIDFYLEIAKRIAGKAYKACIRFDGKIILEGLALEAAFFNRKFDPSYSSDKPLHPNFRIIVATPDAVQSCLSDYNIKDVFVGVPSVTLESVQRFLDIETLRCGFSIFGFGDCFKEDAMANDNDVIASSSWNLEAELKENRSILDYSGISLEEDPQSFINRFRTMQRYRQYEIKGAIKAFIAIYRVYELTEIDIDPELKRYYDWCASVVDSMGSVAVENYVEYLH